MFFYDQYILLFIFFICWFEVKANVTDVTEDTPVLRSEKTKEYDITKLGPELYCKFQSYTYICGDKPSERGYYYDIRLGECTPTRYGHCKYGYNNFNSRSACKKTCGDNAHHLHPSNLTENIACRLQPEFGDCHEYHPKFFFDINLETCRGFSYSGCGGNYNRFSSSNMCKAICIPKIKHEEDTGS